MSHADNHIILTDVEGGDGYRKTETQLVEDLTSGDTEDLAPASAGTGSISPEDRDGYDQLQDSIDRATSSTTSTPEETAEQVQQSQQEEPVTVEHPLSKSQRTKLGIGLGVTATAISIGLAYYLEMG